MRKPEEIRADIEKLTKELEAAKIHEAKQSAAVHILYNLGWKHDNLNGWQKPAPKCSDYKAPLKAGELATLEKTHCIGLYIHSVGNKFSQVSLIRNVNMRGVDVLSRSFFVENSKLTVRPREYFIGRR